MKKITLLSLVTATVLFTACGEDAKKAVTETTTAVVDSAKEHTVEAVEATKKAVSETTTAVVDSAKEHTAEAVDVVKEKVTDAATALKERAAETVESAKETAKDVATKVAVTANNAVGKAAFAKCAGCHGADGKTKALGKSAVIAGESVADLESKLAAYKAGTRNVAGMGMLMKGQVASMSDDDIKAVSEYISAL